MESELHSPPPNTPLNNDCSVTSQNLPAMTINRQNDGLAENPCSRENIKRLNNFHEEY